MTREEAIKIINCYDIGFYDLSGEKITADKLTEAFGMAIEALQTDIVRCEDCKYKGKVGDLLVCRIHEVSTRTDDYCSRGEREEEIQGLEYAESILDSILREQEEGEE